MLTVWRRIAVETLTMLRPAFAQNTFSGNWNEPRFQGGQLFLDIDDQDNDVDLENGYIRMIAPGFPDLISIIITHSSSAFDDVIQTNISQGQWGNRPNVGTWIASDDDIGDEQLFVQGILGSTLGEGTLPTGTLPYPDLSVLSGTYEPAYILPLEVLRHAAGSALPFVRNSQPTQRQAWDPARLARLLPVSTSSYWTVMVFTSFQAELGQDCDQEPTGTKGINTHAESAFGVSTQSGWGLAYTGLCTVFAETLRDAYADAQSPRTVAHEIAHTLGVDHGTELMDRLDQLASFSSQSILELRSYQEP